jgi:hypothetical protein
LSWSSLADRMAASIAKAFERRVPSETHPAELV